MNKFTYQSEDGKASYERRRGRTAPKEKEKNEEDDLETLGTINMIVGGIELQKMNGKGEDKWRHMLWRYRHYPDI